MKEYKEYIESGHLLKLMKKPAESIPNVHKATGEEKFLSYDDAVRIGLLLEVVEQRLDDKIRFIICENRIKSIKDIDTAKEIISYIKHRAEELITGYYKLWHPINAKEFISKLLEEAENGKG